MLPDSGWLSTATNQSSNTVRALLPEPYVVTYQAGSVNPVNVVAGAFGNSLIDGDVDVAIEHGLDSSNIYGILAQLTVHNAYFAALIDAISIQELLSTGIFNKESCPHVTVADKTRDDVVVINLRETCPDVTSEIIEPALPQPALTSFEACCGVLNIPLCNGQYLADGSILVS